MQEAESSIGVEEYDEFVVLDVVRKGRGFDPGSVSVFEFVRVDEFVVVAVDEGVGVVVEDSSRHVVDVAPVVIALFVVLGRLERAGLEIEDQDFAAQLLGVLRVRRQVDVAAIWFADVGRSRLKLQVVVEEAQHFANGNVGL